MNKPMKFDARKHLPSLSFIAVTAIAIAALAGVVFYNFAYNIGADVPHTRFVYNLLESIRDRSIAAQARGIEPPADLESSKRILAGAGLYTEMCTGCHLAPGMEETELSQGLYPKAPELSRSAEHSDAQKFWVIKHGVKLTAMPAWGRTHSDELIWNMVAFVNKLPELTPAKYEEIIAKAPEDHDEMMKEVGDGQPHEGDHSHSHEGGHADH